MKKIFIIDASGYLYSSYFAIRNMTNSQGESTNALYGFIRGVLKLIKDFEVTDLVAVFDGPQNAKKREEIYPEYKAHRSETPKDLPYQIDWARDFCALMGIPSLNLPEVEADDTMGTVASWAAKEGATAYICTTDKDMCQIVNDHIFLLNTRKENLIIDAAQVEEIHGVPPSQIIDLLAMTGDASDNIPGLPGIGPKTAVAFLKQFGSLDNLLLHTDQVAGEKKQAAVRDNADKALLSRRLVTLDLAVPIPTTTDFYQLQKPNLNELRSFYTKMNFNSLIKELESHLPSSPTAPQQEEQYVLVDDEQSLDALVTRLRGSREICFRTTTAEERQLVGLCFAIEPQTAWYIPTNGQLGLDYVVSTLKPLFEDPQLSFYGYDTKEDFHAIDQYGISLATISFDVLLASYLLNSHHRQHSLESLLLQYFSKTKKSIEEICGKGKNLTSLSYIPPENLCHYCCEEVDFICQLKTILNAEIEQRKLSDLLHTIEIPLIKVLAEMERHGIFVDIPTLDRLSIYLRAQLERLQQEIYGLAGEEFNVNSPKQLSHILQDKLHIPLPKKTATGFSTNADILEDLKEQYPIAHLLLEYRSLEKLRSTYVDSLPNDINPTTHRIHCTFNQSVAATGRLSCQHPNLQNIPVRTEEGKKIREAFRPEKENWSYLSADYSQIELRLLAHFSDDPNLIAAFKKNEDIHSHTASTIFGVSIDNVTKEMRHQAKAVNFGIIYGQQAFGLAKELHIDVKEAAKFIEMYFERYPSIKGFIETRKEMARTTGKAVTLTGRERLIPEINSKNVQLRNLAERLAVNSPLQGTAADIIKLAMLKIDELIRNVSQGYMILQIHDELIFELPDNEIEFFKPLVKKAMEGVVELKVPLIVDINLGKNWKEC